MVQGREGERSLGEPQSAVLAESMTLHVEQGTRHVVASTNSYKAAQAVVDELRSAGLPPEHLTITAHDVRLLNSQSRRELLITSTLRSLFGGTLCGIASAIATATMGWIDPLVSLTSLIALSLIVGAGVGLTFGFLWRLTDTSLQSIRRRPQMEASGFDVIVADSFNALRARKMLS